jgi:PIN domain nuclease of toxin-antitoxin system
MPDYVTDTHGLIWYLENDPRLGPAANAAFAECDRGEAIVHIPTICLVEIVYLQEKGRIPTDLKARLDAELSAGGSGLIVAALTAEVAGAVAGVARTAVPDMPDRIIAATALHLGLPLISKDRRIVLSAVTTVW